MPSVKRSAPSASSASTRRCSGRLSSTPKKSNYFEGSSEDELSTPVKTPVKRGKQAAVRKVKADESDEEQYKDESDEDDDEDVEEEEEDDDDNDDSEEEERPRKRGRKNPPNNRRQSTKKEDGDDYANGDAADDDSELDEDAPPKVTIIPLEKLRDNGGVDYEDRRVHKNTMLFLKDLKANNRRDWLKSHDGEYRRSLKDWQSFVEAATMTIIDVDETIPELPAKDVVFRIHRDIRFSKDPTPYKAHFSAAWSRTGKKGPYACYYIHCEPKAAMIGGGLWMPEKAQIDKLRRSIDRHPRRWREVLNDPTLRRAFLPGAKAGEEGAVKAFQEKNKSNALKKRPMGYDADHVDIGLLRLRNYTIGTKVDDSIFTSEDAQQKVGEIIQAMCRFITFLNSIVMPDPGLGEESDNEDEE